MSTSVIESGEMHYSYRLAEKVSSHVRNITNEFRNRKEKKRKEVEDLEKLTDFVGVFFDRIGENQDKILKNLSGERGSGLLELILEQKSKQHIKLNNYKTIHRGSLHELRAHYFTKKGLNYAQITGLYGTLKKRGLSTSVSGHFDYKYNEIFFLFTRDKLPRESSETQKGTILEHLGLNGFSFKTDFVGSLYIADGQEGSRPLILKPLFGFEHSYPADNSKEKYFCYGFQSGTSKPLDFVNQFT